MSLLTLGVRDLARSVRFYEQGLGLPRMPSPPEVAFFTLNGTWLGLYGRQAMAEEAGVADDGGGFAGFTIAHNVHSEQEVDQVLAQAEAAGATLVKPGHRAHWGGCLGYFSDPDGFLWEVAHNPEFWVGPEDN
jgi:catechol 2,3-dioxygenase-like lactoylglutathione lyase family enzyme